MAETSNDGNETEILTREIDKSQKMRRALVKIKHKLKTKIKIPRSATFKEYENFSRCGQPKNDYLSVAIATSRANRHLCLIAGGIKCTEDEKGEMRFELCFGVGPRAYSGYEVQINTTVDDENGKNYSLVKYNLPEGLDVKKIIEKVPMKELPDVIQFLQEVRACGCALLHRKEQVEELKKYCAAKELDVNIFSSYNATYVEISFHSRLLKLTSETEMMSVVLKYDIDTHLPIDILYEKEHINSIDKTRLDTYISDFITFHLKEALRCLLYVKKTQSSPQRLEEETAEGIDKDKIQQSKTSRSEPTLAKKEFAVKNSEEPGTSQRTLQQSTLKFVKTNTTQKHLVVRLEKLPEKYNESVTQSKSPSSLWTSYHAQEMPEEEEHIFRSASRRYTSFHGHKISEENDETMPKNKVPRRVSTRAQKDPEEDVESRSESASPRRTSFRERKVSEENIENMAKNMLPRHVSTRAQKDPEKDVESRSESASPRRTSFRGQKVSEDNVENMTKNMLPRRVSTRAQKDPEEDVESRSESASPSRTSFRERKVSEENIENMAKNMLPRHVSTRAQKDPEEDVESRSGNASPRRTSFRGQKVSEDNVENMTKNMLPRRVSTRAQKDPEEDVESRSRSASPSRTSFSGRKVSEDNVENMTKNMLPRRVSTRAQKDPEEDVESRSRSASPSRTSFSERKVSEDNVENMPKNILPRRVSVRTQKQPEEEIESRSGSASPRRTSFRGKKMLVKDSVESRAKNTFPKNILNSTQNIPMKNIAKSKPFIPDHSSDYSNNKDHKKRLIFFEKSSTPLPNAREQLANDLDLDDISTIIGSDQNVESLAQDTQNVHPVAASTPFLLRNRRRNEMNFVEKKFESDRKKQMNSSKIQMDNYHQTQLNQFIKTGQNKQEQERNKSVRSSLRNKSSISKQHNETDENEEADSELEERRKSGVNVHKSTPVPKGFQSSRVKKKVTQRSVVTGKRLRRK